jgi:hypothetical protein
VQFLTDTPTDDQVGRVLSAASQISEHLGYRPES